LKIEELILQTNYLSQTEDFYNQVLELAIVCRSENSISFQIGDSILTFEENLEVLDPKYHFAFNIPCNNIEQGFHWLKDRLDVIKDKENNFIFEFETWNAKAIYFYDPNNNLVEFIARKDLNNFSEDIFSSKSILNISEVGIATENPIDLSENIFKKFQVEFFEKGPKRDDFVAQGDENGLFVISKTSRYWFPTSDFAEKHDVKIKFKQSGKDYFLHL
jgi:catechol 2,3-dioxygenase-like lactoylglutathione lyase family enzyme